VAHGVVALLPLVTIISIYKQHTGIFKMTLTRDFSYDQLATIKAFFTQGEWDTIDAALEDYKCYADDEAAEEDLIDGIPVMDRIDSIDGKMYHLYKRLG
tara:strand:- start:12 stop:308 length:297 start_codon:yes stop_codon:yes gene_type:complete